MLLIADVRQKIQLAEKFCDEALSEKPVFFPILDLPARDLAVSPAKNHPPKKGLSFSEGQARLLHDLANIELQAMELGYRTLIEFQDAPIEFRESLRAITLSEAKHLELCLNAIEKLGFKWGHWPVHLGLWNAVNAQDSLLDRILIVHRYLEGSGLDAGETLIRRLDSVAGEVLRPVLKTIFDEEIGHVEFGSIWYRQICEMEKIDAQQDFPIRMDKLKNILPRRIEPISHQKRKLAGFTVEEIKYLENLRLEKMGPRSEN